MCLRNLQLDETVPRDVEPTFVRAERAIGICHGEAGVGKTHSARRYASWDTLEPYLESWGLRSDDDAKHNSRANRVRTVFYTPEVLPRHRELIRDIDRWINRLGNCIGDHQRAAGKVTGTHVGDSARWSSSSSSTKPNA